MKIISITLLFSLLILQSCSCSKEELVYSPTELWFLAKDKDPAIETVPIPNHEAHRRVVCENYQTQGCKEGSGKRILVRKVELLVIQFETMEQAKAEAAHLDQWYARNWLLDEVKGEPVLESWVQTVLDAKRGKEVKKDSD